MAVPRIFQSIRFRLSLAIAMAVFAVGTVLIGGVYLHQVDQLDSPSVQVTRVFFRNPETGEVTRVGDIFSRRDVAEAMVEQIERDADREALNQLRQASFGALAVLFFASFGAGWLLSGWALRPVDRITGVARDITATDLSRRIDLRGPDDELKGLADTFDGMLDRLQDSFEDQRRFVHEASHELRNPLAVASTNLEVALDGGSESEVRRAAEIAFRSTGRMTLLVDDLLERARHGVPELRRDDVDLSQLVADAAVEFRAAASNRQLTIDADLGSGDLVVTGDGPALRRAVSNLLANAVRLAPSGSTIELSAVRNNDCIEVSVGDEGPGIAPADQDAVFQRFWRGADEGAGSGLGLTIVRRIAERHGGAVTLTSEVGRGSTFTLRLPAPITTPT